MNKESAVEILFNIGKDMIERTNAIMNGRISIFFDLVNKSKGYEIIENQYENINI